MFCRRDSRFVLVVAGLLFYSLLLSYGFCEFDNGLTERLMLRHCHTMPLPRLLCEASPLRVDRLSEFFRDLRQRLQITPCRRYVLGVSIAERILENRQAFSGSPECIQRLSCL